MPCLLHPGPVFILGAERSGTNLLRAILQSHSQIASPPPAGFVDALAPFEKNYFSDADRPRLDQFVNDLNVLIKTHHNPWGVQFEANQIDKRVGGRPSFWKVFCTVNDIYAEMHNSAIWASKEPGLFRHINEIALHVPNARFVYLVRDGRDVVASMLRGHLHEFHIYFAALNWACTQRLCLAAMSDHNMRSRLHLLKYEALISDPDQEIKKMMEFVGLSYESQQLHFYKNEEVINHANRSRFWKNLSMPINGNNSNQYQNYLSKNEIKIFETIARKELNQLGYQTCSNEDCDFTERQISYYKFIADMKRRFWGLDLRPEARRNRVRFSQIREIINRNIRESSK